ncbi:MAG: hypothetical protein UV02_C0066G0008 [Candidatus Kuenenbacteria bacterium GW2011_GWA2_42_15]|uniref:TRL-like family protein n=1 Tax=Candidatus Kuenenbacteria bacterium GW2011_GWA2_42_15 TaxID=1618677 RepID=A0A0G0YS98_9BACT|nr:MAG: hypothetical protein UV02_C0066G0008 [Candidatus Kuenenbacteria bacterium GW2011_GWA2_42_15]
MSHSFLSKKINQCNIMKKAIFIATLSLFLVSCGARTQSGVSSGIIFTSWNDTISGAVDNTVEEERSGKSCASNVLGIVATGDSSIDNAKRQAGITQVSYADTTYFNILGIYQEGCTVVRGR